MKNIQVLCLVLILAGQMSGCSLGDHAALTTQEIASEMITALTKESAAPLETGERVSEARDGYVIDKYIDHGYELTIILDDQSQELIIMKVISRFDNSNDVKNMFSHMLTYANIEYSAATEEVTQGELISLNSLYEAATANELIKNQYWISIIATEDDVTKITFKKHNADI